MSAAVEPRVVAVLDGTTPGAERRARALGGFLRDGLRLAGDASVAPTEAVTLAFYADDAARDRLVELAPTGDVRLVRTPAFRPDLMAAALTAFEAGGLRMKGGDRLTVTASFGVADFPASRDGAALMREADQALYTAKRLGKNRVVAATRAVEAA